MTMEKIDQKSIQNQAKSELAKAENLAGLNEVFKKYLGKQGIVADVLSSLKNLPEEERKEKGRIANELKKTIESATNEKKKEFQKRSFKQREWIDITAPGRRPQVGHIHPLTKTIEIIEDIFQSMGFAIEEGTEIETEWYNFDALNIPKDHPARDVWDTFWLRSNQKSEIPASPAGGLNPKSETQEKLLLRTHTSPVQIRYMEKNQPPLRIISPGNVFRHEATDPSHEFQLYQVEGLMVDKEISVAHFRAIIGEFFTRFFGKPVKSRLKPDFFPFTEPSFDIGISCFICGGKGCSVCKETGWLEVAGAGMVHPNVFKFSGLNPKEWQGWAFGFGAERLAMMKYKINDIRLFRSGDLRFLQQF